MHFKILSHRCAREFRGVLRGLPRQRRREKLNVNAPRASCQEYARNDLSKFSAFGMGELNEISGKIQPFIRQVPARRSGLRIYRAVCCAQRFFLYLAESASSGSHRDPSRIRRRDHGDSGSHGDAPVPVCYAQRTANGVSDPFAHSRAGGNIRQHDPLACPAIL